MWLFLSLSLLTGILTTSHPLFATTNTFDCVLPDSQESRPFLDNSISLSDLKISDLTYDEAVLPTNSALYTQNIPEIESFDGVVDLYCKVLAEISSSNSENISRHEEISSKISNARISEDLHPLIINIVNRWINHAKHNLSDGKQPDKYLPINKLEKIIKSAVSFAVNMQYIYEHEYELSSPSVRESTVRLLTDFATMLQSQGVVMEDEIQIITDGERSFVNIDIIQDQQVVHIYNVLKSFFDKSDILKLLELSQTLALSLETELSDNDETNMVNNESPINISPLIIPQDYQEDVQELSDEGQQLLLRAYVRLAEGLDDQWIDDLCYELTGVMMLFDKAPIVVVKSAKEVEDMFGWDLSEIVTIAQQKADKLEEWYTEQEAIIAQMDSENDARWDRIAQKRFELAQREDALTQREEALAEKRSELTQREEALTQSEDALTQREDALTQREDELARSSKELREKHNRLKNLLEWL